MTVGKERPDYLSYLLRLWRVSDEGKPVWRASLHDPQTDQRTGFAGLNELFDYLRQQTGVALNQSKRIERGE